MDACCRSVGTCITGFLSNKIQEQLVKDFLALLHSPQWPFCCGGFALCGSVTRLAAFEARSFLHRDLCFVACAGCMLFRPTVKAPSGALCG